MPDSDNIIYASPDNLREVLSEYIGETEKNFFLTDENTQKYCYPLILKLFPNLKDEQVIVIDAGDDSKNVISLNHIWGFLQHHRADRNSILINLGGGMITDIGGFAASTYKRGIPFVHIPTSLLGMVDAAIGGKTAINLSKVKNQVGSFARAEAVIIYPQFLKTLPDEEMLSGYAEAVKTALAFDKVLFEKLVKTEYSASIDDDVIRKAASIKKEVTQKDFRDQSRRQCLNFGHTIGHALESLYMSFGSELKHGQAVAAGMICEAFISVQLSGLPEEEMKQIEAYILMTFPKVEYRMKDIEGIIALIRHDKKNFRDKIRMSLLKDIGRCNFGVAVPENVIRDSLKYYLS